jgi:hypothetical protein
MGRPKVAEKTTKGTGAQSKGFNKFLKWFNLDNNLVIAFLVIIGTIIWFLLFQGLIQYLHPWVYIAVLFISTYIVSTFCSKVFKDSEEKKKKLTKWLWYA